MKKEISLWCTWFPPLCSSPNANTKFYVHVTVHPKKFFLIKPTDALIFQIYFCQEILHVSGSFSAHHQEFSTVHSALAYVIKPAWHTPVPNVQWKTPDDGQRNWPKHVEFVEKNKFGKLVRLLVLLKSKYQNFSPKPVTTQQLPSAAYSNSPLPTTLPPTYLDHKYDEHCLRTFWAAKFSVSLPHWQHLPSPLSLCFSSRPCFKEGYQDKYPAACVVVIKCYS